MDEYMNGTAFKGNEVMMVMMMMMMMVMIERSWVNGSANDD